MGKSARESGLCVGGILLILLLSLLPNIWAVKPAVASLSPGSDQSGNMPDDQPQTTPSPTSLPMPESAQFRITLNELGYDERVLKEHTAQTSYTLVLPYTWELQEGSYLELDFSYIYQELERQGALSSLTIFGELTILIDGKVQQTIALEAARIEHRHLRLNLPLDIFNDVTTRQHDISLLLDASYPCEFPHWVTLTIHPESFFHIFYTRLPLVPNLSIYPRPFYQQAFEPDAVRFILPNQPGQAEMAGAVGVSAKLGELTSERMIISATTDLVWMENRESDEWRTDHLIIIGRPETNKLVLFLNDRTVLPIPLQKRQLGLVGEGTVSAPPGDVLTYTFTITNTTPQLTSPLSLTDILPLQARLLACEPTCDAASADRVSWSLDPLAPGQTAVITLTLQLTDTLTTLVTENTIVLSDQKGNPLNVRTLATTVDILAENVRGATSTNQSDYFFVKDGQPIPETDGVIQEFISPWNPNRAILMITGLTDEAVYKACQAMSTETEFPAGMNGPEALVRLVRPSTPISRALNTEMTLADLGYSDKTIYGARTQTIDYYFFLPYWQLTEDAYVELKFSHSSIIDETNSSINLLFNGKPLVSELLDQSNAINGLLKISLPDSQAKPGANNRLTVQVSIGFEDPCTEFIPNEIWLTVSQDSHLYLDHRERDAPAIDLEHFPIPFGDRSDLADLLFALPLAPDPVEIEWILRLAAALGNMTDGKRFGPAVVLGDADPQTLSDHHIIALGRPSANPLIQQINAQLPQPFVPGTDHIEQQIDDVIFRLPPAISLGYIELLESPWNKERALLAVTGTSREGVEWAVQWLTDSNRRWRLDGNLAMTMENTAHTIDTRELTSSGRAEALATAVPELTPVATVTATPTPTETPIPTAEKTPMTPAPKVSPKIDRPGWLIPLVVFMVLAIIATFAVAIWQMRRQRPR